MRTFGPLRTHRIAGWPLLLVAALLAAGLALPVVRAAGAADGTPVRASDAWVRWLPGGLPVAGYMALQNRSNDAVELTGFSSPDFDMVQLHETITSPDGTSRMQAVDRLAIPAGGEVALKPGGYHLMLMEAKHPISPGDTVSVVLSFSNGGNLTVRLPVKPADTQQ